MAARPDADDIAIDEALEALANGDAEECLGHLEDVPPERGHRWTTACHAFNEMGELAQADDALARARKCLGDDDADVLWAEGRLRLAQWRLADARAAFVRLDPQIEGAPLVENLALLADLDGDWAGADEFYRQASVFDPEGCPLPPRLSPDEFEDVVAEAAIELPDEFQKALEEVPVITDPMPSAGLLGAPESGHPPDILGLFSGAPLAERGASSPVELPPTIFLFQRNLERAARTREDLIEEIRTTLFHELGHALGFDEEGVDELGLA